MSVIFGLLGLLIMVAVFAGAIFLCVLLARKAGILKPAQPATDSTSTNNENPITQRLSIPADLKKITNSLIFRFAITAILILLMTMPLNMVSDIVHERSTRYNTAQSDIAATWGNKQTIEGPALLIPYTERFDSVKVLTDKDGNERKVNETKRELRTAIVLPESLSIDVALDSESRKRGIYEANVYTGKFSINGEFKQPDLSDISNNIETIHWQRAWFSLGISDTQAIKQVSALQWGNTNKPNGNQSIDFEPGTRITDIFKSGFHAPLDLSAKGTNKLNKNTFSLTIDANGSKGFYFAPSGKTTKVKLTSDWPHPSFQGNVLPDDRTINAQGFEASWSIPHLARNYPQMWEIETQTFQVKEFYAGVNLYDSASLYSQIIRAIKYGILFIALTYITFLMFEFCLERRLHFVQYGVIGVALSMFYLTLISMAEHAGFLKAYISAASLITGMISLYIYGVIKNLSKTLIVTAMLTALYSLLYAMLRLEDYALLAGATLLLVVLAIMMYLTRNIGSKETL